MPNAPLPIGVVTRKKHRAGRKVRERCERAIARKLAESEKLSELIVKPQTVEAKSVLVEKPNPIIESQVQNSKIETLDELIEWMENYLEKC